MIIIDRFGKHAQNSIKIVISEIEYNIDESNDGRLMIYKFNPSEPSEPISIMPVTNNKVIIE